MPRSDRFALQKEPHRIAGMFSAIARRYDLLNHLLSCGLDRHWRAVTVGELPSVPGRLVLDLCAGTGDLALQTRNCTVILADFALPMLQRARQKSTPGQPLPCVVADALRLPFAAGSFSAAMSGFGVRNFVDLDAGLREAHRVLAPGAPLLILEFCGWSERRLPPLVSLFIRRLVPLLGRLVSGHASAYSYLRQSMETFDTRAELARRLSRRGFAGIRSRDLTFGVCSLLVAQRGEFSS